MATSVPLEEVITDNINQISETIDSDKEESDCEVEEVRPVAKAEALECIDTLKLYATQGATEEDASNMLKLIRLVENNIYSRKKKFIQKRLEF